MGANNRRSACAAGVSTLSYISWWTRTNSPRASAARRRPGRRSGVRPGRMAALALRDAIGRAFDVRARCRQANCLPRSKRHQRAILGDCEGVLRRCSGARPEQSGRRVRLALRRVSRVRSQASCEGSGAFRAAGSGPRVGRAIPLAAGLLWRASWARSTWSPNGEASRGIDGTVPAQPSPRACDSSIC